MGHDTTNKATWQLDEHLDIDQAEEMQPMACACGIGNLGVYFDKDPYYYLEDDFLQTVAMVCLNWVQAECWQKNNLTNCGQTLITIVAATKQAYSQFVASLNRKKEK